MAEESQVAAVAIEETPAEKIYSTDPMLNFFLKEEAERGNANTEGDDQGSASNDDAAKKLADDAAKEIEAKKLAEAAQQAPSAEEVAKKSAEEAAAKAASDATNNPAEITFANETSKALYEALIGGKEEEVLAYLTASKSDYTKISDDDVVKLKLKKENPGWDQSDVDAEFKDRYTPTEITDQDRIDLTPAQLREREAANGRADRLKKREASDYRDTLNKSKEELKLPVVEKPAPSTEKSADQIQYENETKALEMWLNQVDEGVKSTPAEIDHTVTIDIADGEDKGSYSTQYKITGQDKTDLEGFVRSFIPPVGEETSYVKDGKVDVEKIVNEGINKLFGARMYKSLLKESLAKQRSDLIKGIKHIEGSENTLMADQPISNEDWLASGAAIKA